MPSELWIKYDLKNEEDTRILEHHRQADNYKAALDDLYNYYRQLWKYGDEESIKVEDLWDKFHETLTENDINL